MKKSEAGKLQSNQPLQKFCELLRYYRKRAKLTQRQLKNRLDAQDYDYASSAISMWEAGKRLPDRSGLFHYLGIALRLSEEEEWALLQAWLVERNIRDLEEYLKLKQREGEVRLIETQRVIAAESFFE